MVKCLIERRGWGEGGEAQCPCVVKFYQQLKILKVLWPLLTAKHVDVPIVFYVYYVVQYKTMALYTGFFPVHKTMVL